MSGRPDDGLVTFRSSSEKSVYAGPVVVGDGGSNRNRCATASISSCGVKSRIIV